MMSRSLYRTGKKVLRVSGSAVEAFLNGLTSNVMTAPRNAFLNIHGRIIATFDQYRVDDGTFKLCLEEPFVDSVVGHLATYARISGVRLEVTDERVYHDTEELSAVCDGCPKIPQVRGRLVISAEDMEAGISDEDYTLFRVRHGIAVQGQDYQDEFLLNVSTTDFVSFTKGCYLGQEPVAKVYHRSRPTWRLTVRSQDDCDADEKARMTSKIFNPSTGKMAGFVFVKNEMGKSSSDESGV